jgi:endoglucanase
MTRHVPDFSGFVRAQDARLVDGRGNQLQLRGVGLGNWLLPEGYMWKFGPGAESPREIEALVSRLLGDDSAEAFWKDFRETFISEQDIAKIAASGFDHVRLPINSRVVMTEQGLPIEAGFALIDRVIQWCRKHHLWVLLDLHGAPGGQTGTNIDDSPNNKPELFMDRRYWDQTLDLWRLLATRYAKETVVLGYDLLNEPLPNEWQYQYVDELSKLYQELTAVIRAVDSNHLIVYEGTHWATNWDLFTEVWDENSLLQFHKYWSAPDTASIQKFLDARDRLGLPIYMGESGENNLEWLYTAFRLYESHDIGWNFWPWKKMDTKTSPLSVIAPSGWDEIRDYAHGEVIVAPRNSQEIFDRLLINMRVENCVPHPEIVSTLLADNPKVIPSLGIWFPWPWSIVFDRKCHAAGRNEG